MADDTTMQIDLIFLTEKTIQKSLISATKLKNRIEGTVCVKKGEKFNRSNYSEKELEKKVFIMARIYMYSNLRRRGEEILQMVLE
jgi:hypothetical protein